MKIGILGYEKEGKAALRFLKSQPEYRSAKFIILDAVRSMDYLSHLDSFDFIVKSPGVPFRLPEIELALRKGVQFSSATQLFFEHAKGTIVGVTGTKGKGTTATLIYRMLKSSGFDAHLAGNIGKPALFILPKLTQRSITVLELSSFQLSRLLYSPQIAVVLDVESDHLDWHGSVRDYIDSKASVAKYQKRGDAVFYFPSSPTAVKIALKSSGERMPVAPEKFNLFSPKDMKLPWPHVYKNAVMAASVGLYLGASSQAVKRVATSFRGLPQRLEFRGSKDRIDIYNDSGSTNPHATSAAIRALSKPFVLIMGGKDRGVSYREMKKAMRGSSLRALVLYGENQRKIFREIKGTGVLTEFAATLEDAVSKSYQRVKKLRKSGEEWVILFSPGAASFDMFKDYVDRGRKFDAIVKRYLA